MNYNPYNFGYQPYANQNQYSAYQMPQYQQVLQPQQRPVGLQGEVVDSIDVVKATNVDLNGNVTYYPKADMSEIYTKQLCADGTSRILTYALVKPEQQNIQPQGMFNQDVLNTSLTQMKNEIVAEIQNMIPQLLKGGNQQ